MNDFLPADTNLETLKVTSIIIGKHGQKWASPYRLWGS